MKKPNGWKKEQRSQHSGFETWVLYHEGEAVGMVKKSYRQGKNRNSRSWANTIPIYIGVHTHDRLRDAKREIEREALPPRGKHDDK